MSAPPIEPISAPSVPQRGSPDEVVAAFLKTLLECHNRWSKEIAPPQSESSSETAQLSLELAEAAMRHARNDARRPLQIAVLGPTQTGKSTIVNLLLCGVHAEVSPLAGFTVQAHGFAMNMPVDASWTQSLFPGWSRFEPGLLPRENLHGYTLKPVALPQSMNSIGPIPPCIVWDTPDFDSLGSPQYRRSVIEIAALADVLVFVVSKEKYSDLSVWRMLDLVAPLRRPVILCINKLTEDAATAIPTAVRNRLAELQPTLTDVPIVSLPYRASLREQPEADPRESRDLWTAINNAVRSIPTSRRAGAAALIEKHWNDWTAPIQAQAAAQQQWNESITAAIETAATAYRNEYLEHPQRYDTFRRATVELLDLLEIPGVGGVLGKVRSVVTWPARQLFAAGREWIQKRSNHAPRRGSEEAVLEDLSERILIGMLRDAVRAGRESLAPGFWNALADRLDREQGRLRTLWNARSTQARGDFLPEIHATANRLYELLRERPALLAGFRAARATADVASIALAIKTGGAHINDLLLAPATFAMSSLLAEGALGGYMGRIAADLKARQYEHIRKQFFEGSVAGSLRELAVSMSDDRLFGISQDQARAARAALEEWKARHD